MCLQIECERLRRDGAVVTRRTHRALYYCHDRYLKRKVARSIFQLLWCRQHVDERGLRARAPGDHAALTLGSDVVAKRSHKGAASMTGASRSTCFRSRSGSGSWSRNGCRAQ